jgi:hypothetical protein
MGRKVVSGIQRVGQDGVDFGGIKLWNQEAIS